MIRELQKDKQDLANDILALLNTFEEKYEQDILYAILVLKRFNGSDAAFGKIVDVDIKIHL